MPRWKHKKIAKERIDKLFEEARKACLNDDFDLSNRYVKLALKIGMKYNVSIPSQFRRRTCKNCYSYLFPGKTCRVRINEGKLVTKCFNCKTINRYIIDKKEVENYGAKKSKD
ncbi:MAG: ribonuclease P protein component 4 [Candidatus Saliniplasma sp.]